MEVTKEQLMEELEFAKKEIAVLRAHSDNKDLRIIELRWELEEIRQKIEKMLK